MVASVSCPREPMRNRSRSRVDSRLRRRCSSASSCELAGLRADSSRTLRSAASRSSTVASRMRRTFNVWCRYPVSRRGGRLWPRSWPWLWLWLWVGSCTGWGASIWASLPFPSYYPSIRFTGPYGRFGPNFSIFILLSDLYPCYSNLYSYLSHLSSGITRYPTPLPASGPTCMNHPTSFPSNLPAKPVDSLCQ